MMNQYNSNFPSDSDRFVVVKNERVNRTMGFLIGVIAICLIGLFIVVVLLQVQSVTTETVKPNKHTRERQPDFLVPADGK